MRPSLLIACLFALPAFAADYKCTSGRVEKGGSTQYTYKESSGEIVIEKGGSTNAVPSNDGPYGAPATAMTAPHVDAKGALKRRCPVQSRTFGFGAMTWWGCGCLSGTRKHDGGSETGIGREDAVEASEM